MEQQLSNPNGAFRTVSDFTLGLDADNGLVTPECNTVPYRANAAIAAGDALMFVAPTTTVPISVAKMTAAAEPHIFAGVALNAATAAGQMVQVVTNGHCMVNVGGGTAAAASYIVIPETTTAVFDVDATPDAGDTVVGILWGIKNASNLAFAYVDRSGIVTPFVVNT